MKFSFILLFLCSTICTFAQKYDQQVEFNDGTIIDYSILENNPFIRPNLNFELFLEITTLPTMGMGMFTGVGVQYRLPKKGEARIYGAFGAGEDNTGAPSFSDNTPSFIHQQYGTDIQIDLLNKTKEKREDIQLKSKSSGLFSNTADVYVLKTPIWRNFKVCLDAGYKYF